MTLPIDRLIPVSVNLTPAAAQFASFSTMLAIGDNPVVDVNTRILGPFDSDTDVAALVGTADPLYQAAVLYFSQVPQPANFYIGRWAATATSGLLICGLQPPANLAMAPWLAITSGGFHIGVDGSPAMNIGGLSFAAQTNLNGVASVIDSALTSASVAADCAWNGTQFIFTSHTTGPTSAISFLTPPTSGTDISAMLLGTASTAQKAVHGIAPETPLQAATILDAAAAWYGGLFAATAPLANSDYLAVAAFLEAASQPHIFGVTTQDATHVFDPTVSTDIASELAAAGYLRTFCLYSSYSVVAAATVFGIAFSTNWNAANAAYDLVYKVCLGLTGENIGPAAADAMDKKRCMYFAQYNITSGTGTNVAFLVFGEMSGPAYFDEIHGTDWLANAAQVNTFNLLFEARKIPQTDPGEQLLATGAETAGAQGVVNGLLAPGQWNAQGFGALNQGDNLAKGYYCFVAPVATQSQANREARISNPILMAAKLAGAVNKASVLISVNR